MAREDLHFRLRIPEDLKARVEAAAKENHRSMTAEIVATLEEKYPKPPADDELSRVRPLIDMIVALTPKQNRHRAIQRVDAWLNELGHPYRLTIRDENGMVISRLVPRQR